MRLGTDQAMGLPLVSEVKLYNAGYTTSGSADDLALQPSEERSLSSMVSRSWPWRVDPVDP